MKPTAIPHMTYQQYRAARKLVHQCCNYADGDCLVLECVCVQSISYSVLCRWFRAAVLPQDTSLCAALLYRDQMKPCVICGASFVLKSNRAKYCPDCAITARRRKEAERQRKRYFNSTHLGSVKPL